MGYVLSPPGHCRSPSEVPGPYVSDKKISDDEHQVPKYFNKTEFSFRCHSGLRLAQLYTLPMPAKSDSDSSEEMTNCKPQYSYSTSFCHNSELITAHSERQLDHVTRHVATDLVDESEKVVQFREWNFWTGETREAIIGGGVFLPRKDTQNAGDDEPQNAGDELQDVGNEDVGNESMDPKTITTTQNQGSNPHRLQSHGSSDSESDAPVSYGGHFYSLKTSITDPKTDEKRSVTLLRIALTSELGRGSFGQVFRGWLTPEGRDVLGFSSTSTTLTVTPAAATAPGSSTTVTASDDISCASRALSPPPGTHLSVAVKMEDLFEDTADWTDARSYSHIKHCKLRYMELTRRRHRELSREGLLRIYGEVLVDEKLGSVERNIPDEPDCAEEENLEKESLSRDNDNMIIEKTVAGELEEHQHIDNPIEA